MFSVTICDAFRPGVVGWAPTLPTPLYLINRLCRRERCEPPSSGGRCGANYDRVVSESSLAEVLRARGLRMTPQRQLVLDAVRQLGHATPEQVHQSVQRVADSVNITTVYRTLELLEELGLVTHTHLSHGAPTYHPAGEHQHIHLVCRSCGSVEGVAPKVLEPLAEELAGRHGFLVDVGHVALFGRCATCEETR